LTVRERLGYAFYVERRGIVRVALALGLFGAGVGVALAGGTGSASVGDYTTTSTKPGKGCGDKNHFHERRFECKVVTFAAGTKEGNAGTTPVDFTVVLSDVPLTQVTVDFKTLGGTATPKVDFVPTGGTLTFLPGVVSQKVTVQVLGDTTVEPNETFYLKLSNPSANAYIGTSQVAGTIANDD
jgi:hypothetical protein